MWYSLPTDTFTAQLLNLSLRDQRGRRGGKFATKKKTVSCEIVSPINVKETIFIESHQPEWLNKTSTWLTPSKTLT